MKEQSTKKEETSSKSVNSACAVCGKPFQYDKDDERLLCGSMDCLRKLADELECPKCGKNIRDFKEGGKCENGRITETKLHCPEHPEVVYTRFYYCQETEKCPTCHMDIIGKLDIAYLRQNGECYRCEEMRQEMIAEEDDRDEDDR